MSCFLYKISAGWVLKTQNLLVATKQIKFKKKSCFEEGKEGIPFGRVSSMTGKPNSGKFNFKRI